MKKLLLLLTVCLFLQLAGYGQKREIVLIDYFSGGRGVPQLYSERIRAGVIEGFKLRNRENIVDAEYIPAMNPQRMGGRYTQEIQEEERNKTINEIGCRYIITGHVAEHRSSQAKVGNRIEFTSIFKVILKGIDLATGKALEIEQYDLTGRGASLDEATSKAVKTIVNKINFYVERRMKFETKVLQLCDADNKGRVLELYIGSGSNIGVKEGDQFDLYVEDFIQGRSIRKEIGRITVQGVEGANASRCSMKKKQAPLIIDALNNEKTIIAVSSGEALFY